MEVKKETVKVKHEIYSSGSAITTLRTKTLAEGLTICEEWTLSIDLKLPNRSETGWRNIFSLYGDKNTGPIRWLDQRILAVSMQPRKSNVKLKIAQDMIANQDYEYRVIKKRVINAKNQRKKRVINAGNWINLKISQMSGLYEIKVDYKLVYNKTNAAPKTWKNVKLITEKPSGKENNSIAVHYRNFNINTCKMKSKK